MEARGNAEGKPHFQNADKYTEASFFKLMQLKHNLYLMKDDDIEKLKLDSELELLLRVHKLYGQVENDYIQRSKIKRKLPAKKISLKRNMLKKICDLQVNFVIKNLHEVVKRFKKLYSNKAIFLQKDTEEAYLLKKENCETREEFEIKRSEILEKLDDSKEGLELEKIEIKDLEDILWMMKKSFPKEMVFKQKVMEFNKDLLLNLVKVKNLIDYEETRMKVKFSNKVETDQNKIQVTSENSSKTTVTVDTKRTSSPSNLTEQKIGDKITTKDHYDAVGIIQISGLMSEVEAQEVATKASKETEEDSANKLANGADKEAQDEDGKEGVDEKEIKAKKCCWFCSKEEGSLLKCSGCRKAYYCNEKCIEHDWPVHGNWCSKRRQKREEKKGKR